MIRCYVTDRRHGDLLSHVNAAIHDGVNIIQVREKDLDARELYELVCRIRDAAAGTTTKVLVNDRLDIALAARIDGVHLPANGLPAADDVRNDPEGFERSGLFGSVEFRRYVWDADYSAAEYLELLSSYSGHRALTSERRDGLYGCIGALIDAAGGSITKSYVNELSVGISLTNPLRSGRSAGENIRAGREITRRLSGLT